MRKPKQVLEGLSKAHALVLAFVGLKLSGQLDWNWWWVLSPLWISGVIRTAISIRGLLRSSRSLRKKVYILDKAKWAFQASDGLFLLLFILKWTGHLSWGWFWVFSPLWLFKPLGLLESMGQKDVLPKKVPRYKILVGRLYGGPVSFITVTFVAGRLDGDISSWWWVAAASVVSLLLWIVLTVRTAVALSRRLRREKARRKACRSRDGAEERRPTRSERKWFDLGTS